MSLSSRLSSLGPPRGGRVVRDSREVIREVEEQNAFEQKNINSKPITLGSEWLSEPSGNNQQAQENIAVGKSSLIFEPGNLTVTPRGDFVLMETITPEGMWYSLRLLSQPALGDEARNTWTGWGRQSVSYTGNPNDLHLGMELHSQICPLKTLYWFMRAAYELKDKNYSGALAFRRFISTEMDHGGWHHSEMIRYRPGLNPDIRTELIDQSHPLHYSTRFETIDVPKLHVMPGHGLEDCLGKLLGDNDPDHVDSVLSWCAGNGIKSGFVTSAPLDVTTELCTRFSIVDGTHYTLDLAVLPEKALPAHFVVVDPKYYPKKKVI